MLRKTAISLICVVANFLGYLNAQVSDCVGAIVICSDETVQFAPLDGGNSDFGNPNNDPGCLEDDENGTVWYYFEFNQNMPPNSELEFTLDPFGGFLEDYDFAIYGPNLACDSLGSPVRCSFANSFCDLCPLTGMGMGATDTSEGWEDEDGFIAPLTVQAGEGFYLVIDYFAGNGFGFQLSWGGTAAPYLNCLADPQCNQYSVNAGSDLIFCDGVNTMTLNPNISDLAIADQVIWSDTTGAPTFLTNDSIAQPQLILPDTFTGELVYELMVDFGGCIKYDYLTIRVQPNPVPQIVGDTAICPGSAADLGVGSFASYHWSNDTTTQSISVLEEGQYFVTVTDLFGCMGVDSMEVTFHDTTAPDIIGQSGICANDSTSLSVAAGYQTYSWSTDDQDEQTVIYTPNTYYITVTDEHSCPLVDSIEIQAFASPIPVITGQDSICLGETSTLDAGSGYSSYHWSTGDSIQAIVLTEGDLYQLTVTNAEGCSAETAFNLAVQSNPDANITGDLTFCAGQSTDLSGGTATNLQYSWSGGDVNNQLVVTQAGTYSLTVTNEFGCIDSDTVQVEELSLPVVNIPNQIGLCEGLAVTVFAGTDGVNYLWSDGTGEDSLVVAAAGNYDVAVTAANGCSTIVPFEVIENPSPEPQFTGEPGFCDGETTQLSVDSWSSYQWSSGQTTASITLDEPGVIVVTVTDNLGCLGTGMIQVEEWALPEPMISGDSLFCPGQETTLTSSPNFVTYLWSTGDETPNITTAETGPLVLSVTDNNGCVGSTNFSLNLYAVDPPALPGDTSICAGDTVQMDAGIGYQTYLWSDNSDSRFFSTDIPGTYSVTVVDTNGCPSTTFFALNAVSLPMPEVTPDLSLCPGDTAQFVVNGNYLSYQWSDEINSGGNVSLSVVTPGTYSVTVEDNNHCLGTASTTLSHFALPEPSIIGNSSYCEGDEISLQVATAYPVYLWSNGAITDEIAVNDPGIYSLTVTDLNGCLGSTALDVEELSRPEVNINAIPYFCEGGSTVLAAPGGLEIYAWSNGSETNSIEVSEPGAFSVSVTDINGCTNVDSIDIQSISLPPADAGGDFSINCFNNSVQLGNEINGPYTFQWTGPDIDPNNAFEIRPVVGIAGLYNLIMKDTIYGCESAISSAMVEDLRYEPAANLSLDANLDCNHPTALIDGENSSNGNDIVYLWYNPNGELIQEGLSPNLQVNVPGLFELTVLDTLLGCEGMASIEVSSDFVYPDIIAGADTELNCYESVLSLSGEVTAAQNGYTIQWEAIEGNILSGQTTLNPMIDEAGIYVLNIVNPGNGCASQDTVQVIDRTLPPVAMAQASDNLDCVVREVNLLSEGSSTGPAIIYSWQILGGELLSGGMPEVTSAGGYMLIVTDQTTGCSDTAQVSVLDVSNPPLDLQWEIAQPKCYQDATGSLSVLSIEGGTGPFLYRLNDDIAFRPDSTFDQLPAGNYELVVQDAEGCELMTSFQIESSNEVLLDLGEDLYVNLGTTVDLQALTNLTPSQTDQLIWTSSAGESCNVCPRWSIQPLGTTQVIAEITDINGCTAQDELTIFVKKTRDVYIPNAISPNFDGINDAFTVYSGKDVRMINNMKIFDRWGGAVFEAFDFYPNNPAEGWDGKYKGAHANGNVFVYVVEVEFIDGEVMQFSGDVTIVY